MTNIFDEIIPWLLIASTVAVFVFAAFIFVGGYATGAARHRRDYDQGSLDD